MPEPARLTTSLNRKWVTKMTIFLVALLALGLWGTADALWIYPKRGEGDVEFKLLAYLDKLKAEGKLQSQASVDDPAAVYKQLSASKPDQGTPEWDRYQWLEAVSRVRSLRAITARNQQGTGASGAGAKPDPIAQTVFPNPEGRRAELEAALQNRDKPTPLAFYDLPLQYFFAIGGFAGGIYMIFFLLRCRATRYEFDPVEKRLFLPGNKSFVPADITEVDKRDWHKYYLYMKINGFNGDQKFDLLRWSPLETWLEEMRKLRPGYDPAEDEPAQPPAEPLAEEPNADPQQPTDEPAPKP